MAIIIFFIIVNLSSLQRKLGRTTQLHSMILVRCIILVFDEVLVSVSPTITNRHIEISGLGESDFNVTIYSHLGHELASFRRSKTIDVSSFSSGLYIVHVVHPKGTSQVKFMVR